MDTTPVEVPLWAVNQLEVLDHQCADAGKCHHACDKQLEKTCFRKECALTSVSRHMAQSGLDSQGTSYHMNVFSVDHVICYVAEQNDREDPYEGELPERMLELDSFVLKEVNICDLDIEGYGFSQSLADEYALMPSISSPPIVIDSDCTSILDGYHRVHAALIRGDKRVMAYVGIEN